MIPAERDTRDIVRCASCGCLLPWLKTTIPVRCGRCLATGRTGKP